MPDTPERDAEILRRALDSHMNFENFPHGATLGLRFEPVKGGLIATAPYDERLIGDPATGVIHGGVVTTLLDTGCGVSTMFRLGADSAVATVDLRIDYMRPAKVGAAIHAFCECYRLTRFIAFCRGVAYDEDRNDPVATAAGAFAITRRGGVAA